MACELDSWSVQGPSSQVRPRCKRRCPHLPGRDVCHQCGVPSSFGHCSFLPMHQMSCYVAIPIQILCIIHFSHAVSIQTAVFFEEQTLDVLIVSLNGFPKAELISPAARRRVILQVKFPDATRAYSLDHMGHHLPQHTSWHPARLHL